MKKPAMIVQLMSDRGSAPSPSFTVRKGYPNFVLKPEPGKPGRKRGTPNKGTKRTTALARELFEQRPWNFRWIAVQLNKQCGTHLKPRTVEMRLRRYHPELFHKNP